MEIKQVKKNIRDLEERINDLKTKEHQTVNVRNLIKIKQNKLEEYKSKLNQ